MEGNKRVSLDELARMVKEGFDDVERMRNDMMAAFVLVNKRIGDIETQVAGVERHLTSSRIDRIEDDIRVLKNKVGIR